MRRSLLPFVPIALLSAGCFGDAAATRTLTVRQLQSTTAPADAFDVDTSQLPDWAVERSDTVDHWGNKSTNYTIRQAVPVRVQIVPATRPAGVAK